MAEIETTGPFDTAASGDARPRAGVRSVEVAGQILAALAETGGAVSLTALAGAAGIPPGKVHRYLVSLTRAGLVEQDAASGRYGIGPAAIALGLAGLRQLDPVRSASEVLATLRDEVGETAVLAIWGNRGPVVVRILESSQPVSMNMRPGYVLPVGTSAIGLVFSAYLPASVRDSVTAGTGETSPSNAEPGLDEKLAAIRDRGMLGASGIMVPGVSVLAAPYFDHEGTIAGVLALLGREGDLDISRGGEPARCLDAATAEVTGRLGGSAPIRPPVGDAPIV